MNIINSLLAWIFENIFIALHMIEIVYKETLIKYIKVRQ